MRHRYDTHGIILSRAPLGETSVFVTALTPELGLVRARAQGLRRPGAKLSAALVTFAESELTLMRGAEGWRIAGAVLVRNRFRELRGTDARRRAARVCTLLERLVAGEMPEKNLFAVVSGLFDAFTSFPEEYHDATEVLAALRLLSALGLDAGSMPGEGPVFSPEVLTRVALARASYVSRINRGIQASGL